MKSRSYFVTEQMGRKSEREHLLRRSVQERELACSATDTRAAEIHFAMFAEYERRLSELPTAPDWRSASP